MSMIGPTCRITVKRVIVPARVTVGGEAMGEVPGRQGAPRVRRVLLVLATSGGGTGRHVADLARGLSTPSLDDHPSGDDQAVGGDHAVGGGRVPGAFAVTVAGPRETLDALELPAGVARVAVSVSTRPDPRRDAATARVLRRLAREVDVVHAHGVRAGALAVLAARTLRRRPAVVVTAHNAAVGGRGVRAVHALLATVVARGADAVLAVSGDLVDELQARGAPHAARALVPAPPLLPASRTPAEVRAELEVPAAAALLVTAARLAPQKGVDVLADALAGLARGRPDLPFVAVWAGEGPLADVAEKGPLRLLGPRRDVADLLAAADVVVVPSRWEGQPLIVQEALRAGAAIVATDAGGTREVAADAACLVPPGNPRALADAVERLLDDPAERDRLRVAARARAADLPTAADAVEQVRALYERAAAGRRSH
jgi:glycosyltransferase involved in cell wall biosynthesis